MGSIPVAANNYAFAGPTKTVTTSADQVLVGAAQAPLALSLGGPQEFRYGLCYQSSAGGAINNFVGNGYSQGHITTTRMPWAASASVTPGAGTWKVGYCVLNAGSGVINNDWVNGWVQVVNGGGITVASTAASKDRRAARAMIAER